MNHKNTILIIIIFAVVFINGLKAQDGCSTILSNAIEAFNEGKYDECIKLLEVNIDECKFSKTDYAEASKILSSAYYEIDELEKGDNMVYSFLKKNPNYSINKNTDPFQFVQAFTKFSIRPKFYIGADFGTNKPLIKVLKQYRLSDSVDYSKPYDRVNHACFSLYFWINFNDRITLQTGIGLNLIRFERRIPHNYYLLKAEENIRLGTIPLNLNYNFKSLNIMGIYPSVYAGVSFFYNIDTEMELDVEISGDIKETPKQFGETNVISLSEDMRKQTFIGYNIGTRLNFEYNRIIIFGDFSFSYIPYQFNNKNKRYTNDELLTTYSFISDDFKFDINSLTLGIIYKFNYKVKHKYKKGWQGLF